jgi:hypothetical protein
MHNLLGNWKISQIRSLQDICAKSKLKQTLGGPNVSSQH